MDWRDEVLCRSEYSVLLSAEMFSPESLCSLRDDEDDGIDLSCVTT